METIKEQTSFVCCLCGENAGEFGNNPAPLAESTELRCCDGCNITKVIPARIKLLIKPKHS